MAVSLDFFSYMRDIVSTLKGSSVSNEEEQTTDTCDNMVIPVGLNSKNQPSVKLLIKPCMWYCILGMPQKRQSSVTMLGGWTSFSWIL